MQPWNKESGSRGGMMKSMVLSISLVLALACNVLAADDMPAARSAKDLCLLDSNKCEGSFRYDIVEKIRRLNAAIRLGETVYTREEVEHLRNILAETRDSFDFDNNDFMDQE
jgi:hypothetical protein